MRRRRIFVVVPLAVIAVALVWVAGSYAYTRVFWPRSIQRSLIGKQVIGYADLTAFSDERGPFGEGFLRWTYANHNKIIMDPGICRRFVRQGCSFNISRKLDEGVAISIEVHDGRGVTINEIWS
jgi:hypothetical protein